MGFIIVIQSPNITRFETITVSWSAIAALMFCVNPKFSGNRYHLSPNPRNGNTVVVNNTNPCTPRLILSITVVSFFLVVQSLEQISLFSGISQVKFLVDLSIHEVHYSSFDHGSGHL